MKKEQILNAISNLSAGQGFYGRLYEKLIDGTEESEDFLNTLEKQNFSDIVDMVMWLES